MSNIGIMNVAVGQSKPIDIADIDIVGMAGARAGAGPIPIKLGVVNGDAATQVVIAEEAVLVVVEGAVLDSEITAFVADARTVSAGDLHTREVQVSEDGVAALIEHALAVRGSD